MKGVFHILVIFLVFGCSLAKKKSYEKRQNDAQALTCRQQERDFSLLLRKASVTDYVSAEGMPSLNSITVCFWMRSDDKTNQGTPFSYFVQDGQQFRDEVQLFNYQSFAFWIGNRTPGPTSVSATDGQWHHICTTWENTAGAWKIYKDGAEAATGTGLQRGHVILGGSILFLGQEVDKPGDVFDASQSFIGDLSGLNVWDHVLTAQEISNLSNSCLAGEGNVFRWTDFKFCDHHGGVQTVHPSSCES